MTRTAGERNLDAEVRAVEEGHRAIVLDVNTFRVVSDTRPGKAYVVRIAGWRGMPALFDCTPHGTAAYEGDHKHVVGEGVVPCKHAAVAARRMEREGGVRFDPVSGWWMSNGPELPAPDPARLDRYRGAGGSTR